MGRRAHLAGGRGPQPAETGRGGVDRRPEAWTGRGRPATLMRSVATVVGTGCVDARLPHDAEPCRQFCGRSGRAQGAVSDGAQAEP